MRSVVHLRIGPAFNLVACMATALITSRAPLFVERASDPQGWSGGGGIELDYAGIPEGSATEFHLYAALTGYFRRSIGEQWTIAGHTSWHWGLTPWQSVRPLWTSNCLSFKLRLGPSDALRMDAGRRAIDDYRL
jgi:hypothetical protein